MFDTISYGNWEHLLEGYIPFCISWYLQFLKSLKINFGSNFPVLRVNRFWNVDIHALYESLGQQHHQYFNNKYIAQIYAYYVDFYPITQKKKEHDDIIKWAHFPRYRPFVREFTGHRWTPRTKASDAKFDVLFDLRLNKRLSKQSWGWWFETPSRP